SKGSAAKLLRPRIPFALNGAHFMLTRLFPSKGSAAKLLRPRIPFALKRRSLHAHPALYAGSQTGAFSPQDKAI
ncbi:MAG: hypothetical protein WA672_13135, partial [Candidatus Angelobacter sp.]